MTWPPVRWFSDSSRPEEQPEAPETPVTDPQPAGSEGTGGSAGEDAGPRRRGPWPGVALRAVVVIVLAGIGYQLVVPVTSTVRRRLADLVVTRTGVAAFPGAPAQASAEASSTGGVAAVEAAAKAHPDQTGLYVASWTSKANPSEGMAVVTFLLPDPATAAKARTELEASQLSADAFTSSGLTRKAQFTPAGISGASGSLYGPTSTKAGAATGEVAVVAWQSGKTTALVEAAVTKGSAETDAVTTARAEAAHLEALGSGFGLSVTRHPTVASIVWIAGSVVVLILVAGGPVELRRRRRRRARRLEEEQARTIRVGASTIVRKRRDA